MAWHRSRTLLTIIITLSLLTIFSGVIEAQGAQDRVRVVATESGSYDWKHQLFMAQGDVEITLGDLLLRGDALSMDVATGEVLLQGNVSLVQGSQELTGEVLSYNLETGIGSFDQVRAEFVLAQETGSIFISGKSIGIAGERYKVQGGKFTTCDLEHSHFHLATKELEYIAGEKVIIRGVTYYEGRIPLFYWPYLVIPLDLDDRENFFTLPVFGYGEREGYYMKNTFNYYFNTKSYGHLYLDLFTSMGVGVGARHYYDLDAFGKGSIYVYGVPTSESPVLKSAFSHNWTKDSWNLSSTTNYENSWVKEELSSQNRLQLTLPQVRGEAWLNYKRNPEAKIIEQRDLGFKWSQNLTNQWNLNLQGTLTDRVTTERTRMLDYLAETRYRQGKHTLTLAAQQQYNPDLLDSGSTAAWRSVQRLPELKWEVSDLGIDKLPLRSLLSLGHYGERPSTITMNRAYGQLTLGQKSWRPITGTTVNYQGHVAGAIYGDGQRQTWTYGRAGVTQRLTDSLQLTTTYSRRDVWGQTPFRFDRQNPLQDLGLRLSYTDAKWRTNVSTSYNFLAKKFASLTLQTTWRPSEEWTLSGYASYDLNARNLVRIVPMVEYKNDQLDLGLGVRYQPANKVLERVDARISLPVGSTWQISYDSIFEPPKQAFTKGTISVSKDLHCRELSASYDHVANRVALQLTIKAFPTLPIGWDSDGGLSLFDLEEVSDIIGVKE